MRLTMANEMRDVLAKYRRVNQGDFDVLVAKVDALQSAIGGRTEEAMSDLREKIAEKVKEWSEGTSNNHERTCTCADCMKDWYRKLCADELKSLLAASDAPRVTEEQVKRWQEIGKLAGINALHSRLHLDKFQLDVLIAYRKDIEGRVKKLDEIITLLASAAPTPPPNANDNPLVQP